MKKGKKKGSKSKPKKKSGTILGAGAMGGKKKRPKKKSGFSKGMEGWGGAFMASALIRFMSGGVAYIARTQNMGEELPKMKIAAPAIVALLAKNGIIPVPGMFPAAVQALTDAVVDNTAFLKDIFDLKFMDKDPAKPKTMPAIAAQGLMLRSPYNTPRMRSGSNGSPLARIMNDRGMNFRH